MVEELQLQDVRWWYPTRAAGQRMRLMQAEFGLNHRGAGGHSLAEMVWGGGDVEGALATVPKAVLDRMRRDLRRLLQPWPEGRYTLAYRRSGGILNAFTPSWGEREDEPWAEMVADWEATSFPSQEARQRARQALEQHWNASPHPFFAGLTPAQVMVGGGMQEALLVVDFFSHLTDTFLDRTFESEGQALVQTLMTLRGWQHEPQDGGLTPFEIICAEREVLLERRAQLMAGA